jgi:uncharacterized protein YggT (Ycf19 family)
MQIIAIIVLRVIELYQLLILVWAFGSFFPQFKFQQWYKVVSDIVQPYMNLFRWLPLQIRTGGSIMDLSPIVAIFALQLFASLIKMAISGGRP